MPNYETHPLRVVRRRLGLEMKELARLAGVSRATVSQIEEGRTKRPNVAVLRVLSSRTGVSVDDLLLRVERWREVAPVEVLPRRGAAVLGLEPEVLLGLYGSFEAWRRELSDNPTHFASLLRINRMTVAKYERGGFVGGMPDSLAHALVARLGVSDEYLLALEGLSVG